MTAAGTHSRPCAFCRVVSGAESAEVVLDEASVVGFLDRRPLFPGHVLVVPREHHYTLIDLPESLISPVFSASARLAKALTVALGAEGSFIAVNNVVSQSVDHLHVHVVPRRRGDGLRGFFWPRNPYPSAQAMAEVASSIRRALHEAL